MKTVDRIATGAARARIASISKLRIATHPAKCAAATRSAPRMAMDHDRIAPAERHPIRSSCAASHARPGGLGRHTPAHARDLEKHLFERLAPSRRGAQLLHGSARDDAPARDDADALGEALGDL